MALSQDTQDQIDLFNLQIADVKANCETQCTSLDRQKLMTQKRAVIAVAGLQKQIDAKVAQDQA